MAALTQGQKVDFSKKLLGELGAPATEKNVAFMLSWMDQENSGADWNPLATTKRYGNTTNFNGNGVKNYETEEQGVIASAQTLRNTRYYPTLLAGLKAGTPELAANGAQETATYTGNKSYYGGILKGAAKYVKDPATRAALIAAGSAAENYDGVDSSNASKSNSLKITVNSAEGDAVTFVPFCNTAAFQKPAVELASPIIYEGLETPGALEGDVLVGNPHLRSIEFPAKFQVMISENGADYLTVSANSQKVVEIPLNVSLKSMSTRSSHVINKRNTRTGFHISFWGQEIDTISGTGSTGIFMNQLGLASLMSSNVSMTDLGLADVARLGGLLKQEASTRQGGLLGAWNNLWTSQADRDARAAAESARNKSRVDIISDKNALRVASQDAFIEILSLFKFNGITRFRTETSEDAAQLSVATWGPSESPDKVGLSDAMFQARRGDVLSRGFVVFKLKGRTHLGYFKSFNFALDAEKPFTWEFEFTFKVLRSLRAQYVPIASSNASTASLRSRGLM
jgi:hypothetical protein